MRFKITLLWCFHWFH